eukprot:scaffold10821_cov199-Amphora_coffeaeformis.AAC.16
MMLACLLLSRRKACTHSSDSLIYCLANRNSKKTSKAHGKISFQDLARKVSAEWKATPPEHKALFERMAAQDKIRHQQEMVQFNAWQKEREEEQQKLKTVKEMLEPIPWEEHDCTTAVGGPFPMTYRLFNSQNHIEANARGAGFEQRQQQQQELNQGQHLGQNAPFQTAMSHSITSSSSSLTSYHPTVVTPLETSSSSRRGGWPGPCISSMDGGWPGPCKMTTVTEPSCPSSDTTSGNFRGLRFMKTQQQQQMQMHPTHQQQQTQQETMFRLPTLPTQFTHQQEFTSFSMSQLEGRLDDTTSSDIRFL